mmetsp:Transcript_87124/g.154194  ORF Transcript_87124/g.154194 Transcript_87124/m.154194 type:complete len:173 (-) Transcript_87124:95-613(-)|eukprot:CAMPEP_0197648182 /NCGR_PEP_ID=MMETSP1338-20131121/27606_1 /TAXON_ID=43686 ORGANISM="Pelagodinium beii, Strain RCC1491" /NCGR_SAMPLE_ID=MMETSP1338 /ASSEMBLY_ACC=CAM_ASM_000754 /LENGTH=172 /DNA_ID=CAMNT_0043222141 /DNA_START=63 /DNA_END=581 /DNA_ORIENTATION=+
MSIAIGNVLANVCLFTSVMTTVIGLIYIYYNLPKFDLKWASCGFTDPDEYTSWVDCNQMWQNSWGVTALPAWTPLLMGVFGSMMKGPLLLQVVGFPKNFTQYGIFLIFQALFGDFGYCGKLGVMVGWLSIVTAVVCMVAGGYEIKSQRMVDLEDGDEENYETKESTKFVPKE